MDFQLFIIIIIAFSSILIGLLSFFANKKSQTNISFAIFSIFTSIWITSNYLSNSTTDYSLALFWNKVIFASSSIILGALLLFSLSYPYEQAKIKRLYINTIGIVYTSLALVSFTNLVVSNIEIQDQYSEVHFGLISPVYFLAALGSIIISITLLSVKYFKSKGLIKLKLKYLFLGLSASVFGALVFNILLPLFLNDFSLSNIGPLFLLVFLISVFFGIKQHKLLDIRFLIGKFLFYSLSAVLPYLIFFTLAFFYENRYGTSLNSTAYILGIPIGITFVYIFSITDEFLRRYTDTRLINPGYNPLEEADDLNKQLSRTVDLVEITNIATNKIAKTIRPAYQAIFVIPEDTEKPWLSYSYKDQKILNPEGYKKILNIWARLDNVPLIIDEFSSLKIDEHEPVAVIIKELAETMKTEQLKVIYPLLQNEQIVGMLILGEKEADSPYSIQEEDFIDSISNTLALAVGKSLLYEELQTFNEELQNRVEAATEELKVKNTSLENALSELEDKRRQERDMVDVMGHELRTPISIARNALAILEDKFDKNDGNIEKEKLGKYLTMAVEATRREITLLETLLSATKLEGNRIQLNLTKVSVDELIENTLEAHKYKAQEKNLTLNVEKEDGMFIFSDKVRTQEIIDNFVSNAVKYTAAGSVTIKVYKKDGFIRFDIVDTGIGIQQEDLEKLGGKFFRARKLYGEGTTEDYVHPSGTGLGLFVTFELIHLMGGNREVLSEVGKGSTFAAELPEFTGQKDQNLDQTFMETGNTNVGATSSET